MIMNLTEKDFHTAYLVARDTLRKMMPIERKKFFDENHRMYCTPLAKRIYKNCSSKKYRNPYQIKKFKNVVSLFGEDGMMKMCQFQAEDLIKGNTDTWCIRVKQLKKDLGVNA